MKAWATNDRLLGAMETLFAREAWKASRESALREVLDMLNNTANTDWLRDSLHCMINEVSKE